MLLRRPSLPLSAALIAALTVGVGVGIEVAGGVLGTATPPFVMARGLRVDPLVVVSLLAAAAAVLVLPRVLALRSALAFAAGLFAASVILGVALNVGRFGIDGLDRVFDVGPTGNFEAKNEYLPGLPAMSYGASVFLDRFAEIVPSQPVNVAGHPPGFMLVLHALGISTAPALAALCIGAGSLTAPLTYGLGRALHGERAGRVAGVLAALSPALLLVGVTSADFVFAAIGVATAWLLVARPWAGAAALALAAFFSWALLGIGAWAALLIAQRDGLRRAVLVAAACGLAVVVLNGALAALFGYDALATLLRTHGVYENSLARLRPYAFWAFGSPVAWGVMLGLPIAGAALTAVARRNPAALALAAVIVVAAVLGFTKAETERIWLIFVPLACVAAATVVPERRVRAIAALLLAQALVTQLAFDTVW